MNMSDPAPARPGSGRRAGRPADADSAATRLQLLQAAIKCFGDRGLSRTTLRDVSTAAGLTPGTLYHHYSTKEALYIAAYAWTVEEIYAELEHAIRHQSGVRARMVAVLRHQLVLAKERPELMDFVLRAWVEHDDSSGPLPIPDAVYRYLDRLADDAIGAGEISEEKRSHLYDIHRAMMWGVSAISMTGLQNATTAAEGFIQLVEGTLFAPAPARRRRLGSAG
jgi:AcrR family transcriptional regulator